MIGNCFAISSKQRKTTRATYGFVLMTTKQAMTRIKADMQSRGLSKNTLSSYLTHIKIFLDYCQQPIEELNEKDVRESDKREKTHDRNNQ